MCSLEEDLYVPAGFCVAARVPAKALHVLVRTDTREHMFELVELCAKCLVLRTQAAGDMTVQLNWLLTLNSTGRRNRSVHATS